MRRCSSAQQCLLPDIGASWQWFCVGAAPAPALPALKHLLTFLQGRSADEAKVKEFTEQLEGVLDVFETTLSTRPYLAGKQHRSSLCTWGCKKGTEGIWGTSEGA